jgi:hypothetical protein
VTLKIMDITEHLKIWEKGTWIACEDSKKVIMGLFRSSRKEIEELRSKIEEKKCQLNHP